MGGCSNYATVRSQTAPWAATPREVYLPLWKELPWHLEHPGYFALMAGSLITIVLWLLVEVL